MNLEEQLKRAFSSAGGGEEAEAASYARFEEAYAERTRDPAALRALDREAEAAELGVAAYYLGIHFALHGQVDDAVHWLEIAAREDIGDAAIRLARVYETRAVSRFNREPLEDGDYGEVDAFFSEAYDWYNRAAAAGYGGGDSRWSAKLESPLLSLDCCPSVREMAASEKAGTIVESAKIEAVRLLRQARTDVNAVVGNARVEVQRLATQRQHLAGEVARIENRLADLSHVAARARGVVPRLLLLFTAGLFSGRARGHLVRLCVVYLMSLDQPASASDESVTAVTWWRRVIRWLRHEAAAAVPSSRSPAYRDALPHWAKPATRPRSDRPSNEHPQEAFAGHGTSP